MDESVAIRHRLGSRLCNGAALRAGSEAEIGCHMTKQRQKYAGRSIAEDLIDESPDALLALSLDGRILAWNRGAEVIFGYAAEDAVGKPIDELVIPEGRRAEARKALADVIE